MWDDYWGEGDEGTGEISCDSGDEGMHQEEVHVH